MKATFLNTTEECRWLRDTALKSSNLHGSIIIPEFQSAFLTGNEDCPATIQLFKSPKPDHDEKPDLILSLRSDATYEAIPMGWSTIDG